MLIFYPVSKAFHTDRPVIRTYELPIMRILIFLLAASFLSPTYAEPTIEDYGALPEIQNMAISPNGELVAYRNVSGDRDFIVVFSFKEDAAVAALDVSLIKPRDVFFVNNEQVLLRAAEYRRVRGFRGRFDVSTLFSLDIDSGKVKQLLVPGDGVVYPGQTGLGRVVGDSPNGKHLFMPAFYGVPTLVMGEYAKPVYSLLRVPLGPGKARRVELGRSSTIDYFVDDSGEAIVMEEFDETQNLHSIRALQQDGWQEIYRSEGRLRDRGFVGLTPDRKHLVVLDTSAYTGRTAYSTLSLSSGDISDPLYDRDDADIARVVVDTQRVVQGLQYSGVMPTYKFFDEAVDRKVREIQAVFPEHSVRIVDHSPDWKHIIVLMEGSQSSGEYYLFSEGSEPEFIGAQRPNIPPEEVNPVGTVTFSARDGLRIPTIITVPRERVTDLTNLPAVIMPHGGPVSYDEIGFDYRAQALASKGYLVIMPQFRGSSGLGSRHRTAGYGEWGRKMQDDLSDAVRFFDEQGIIDPDRVCIVGGSYGGYAALAGGAFSPELYKCVVSINGIGNLERFRDWVREQTGRSSEELAYWEMQIGRDHYSPEDARARSPELAADDFAAPVLLIHSKSDEIVPISQSRRMYRALERAGKKVELLELDGDDHYLSFGDTRTQALKATVRFIEENL
ncbi:MAG: alpha/beta fold hydrolase [Woeseiaceae bacterium]|nr:alpha/beta fold hydrolase [Woeseiaceae bacterium]